MKPCKDIEWLYKRANDYKDEHDELILEAAHCAERIDFINRYVKEILKPGFDYPNKWPRV